MPYKRALYYPYMDINNESWLKNAIFYWDEISTIVPGIEQEPYKTPIGKELEEIGMLKPLHSDEFVKRNEKKLTENVINYFNTPECLEVINKEPNSPYQEYIYNEKLPPIALKRLMNKCKKVDTENIIDSFYEESRLENEIRIDSRFFNFYMTLLATMISEESNIGLLTDNASNSELSINVKVDSLNNSGEFKNLSEGTLINMTFENLNINSDTPLDKIIEFRDGHSLELTQFKKEILEISSSFNDNPSIEEIIHVYNNELKPQLDSLKESLRNSKIEFTNRGFINFITILPFINLIPDDLIGTPIKVLSSAGLSIAASNILYNIKKKEILRSNPYSYLLSVENTFNR